MGKSPHWRERLLGTLEGQLQLATYLAVFVGFTGASCAGLWVSERSLFRQHEIRMMQEGEDLTFALKRLALRPGFARVSVEQQLNRFSSKRTLFWLERADDTFVLPTSDNSRVLSRALLNRTPTASIREAITYQERNYLVHQTGELPDGSIVWASCDVTLSTQAFGHFINWMILIWSLCLVLTLWLVTVLVRRIVSPLVQLTELTASVTAETLQDSHVQLAGAPQEINLLARNYEDLLHRLSLSWSHQRQFVSAVSHELRTPLTLVGGYIKRTIRRGDNLEEQQLKGLQTAAQEAERMRHLLDDLLDISRGDSGRLSISQQPVSLLPLLSQVQDLAQTAHQRVIDLRLPDAEQVVASADPDRLQQVVLNLIENACKYSDPPAAVELELKVNPSEILVEVRDHGIGVPVDDQERIFERFQRASNAPHGAGSGLGLSVVRLLVEGMGGQITMRSQVGEGSVFTLHLRLIESSERG